MSGLSLLSLYRKFQDLLGLFLLAQLAWLDTLCLTIFGPATATEGLNARDPSVIMYKNTTGLL